MSTLQIKDSVHVSDHRANPIHLPQAAWSTSRRLVVATVVFFAGFVACSCIGLFDAQTINGASVWAKPAKFHLSVAINCAMLAWAATLLEPAVAKSRSILAASALFVSCGGLELVYIALQAARGEASHFNSASPLYRALYAMMGVGAVTMLVSSGYIGARVLRRPNAESNPVLTRAVGLGLLVGAIVGGIVGAYMSAQTGHWVGGLRTDAGGLPFSGWSTTGGDLRVPHFFGLHTAQVVAAAGWLSCKLSAPRGNRIVTIAAVLWTVLALAILVQALSGRPLIAL
jgi:hypothetical protein